MSYTPPFPHRPEIGYPPWRLLRIARENLVAIWSQDAFSDPFIQYRLLLRQTFVCNSPETVRFVFIENADVYERKSPQQRQALRPLIGDGLFISEGETWRQRRKAIAPLTHISKLADLAPLFTQVAAEQLDEWRSRSGEEIDALAVMAEMTADIICRTIFGAELARGAASTIVQSFSEYQTLIGQMDLLSLLGLPDFVPRPQGRKVRRAARRIHDEVQDLMTCATEDTRRIEASLISSLAETGGAAFAGDAVQNEAVVLFMAGHETTANTLAWAWFLLSQDPATERRLHEEVDRLGGRAATFDDVANLPFTRAVIEETLRLYPPVPIQARQATQTRTICGIKVPSGSIVMVSPWLLHRNPNHWTQPDAFLPDRFLPENAGQLTRYTYVPFSIGPRVCPGAAFGLTEAIICLATLAQHFRLRLRANWTVAPVCRLTLRPGDELPMRLEPRGFH